MKTRNWFDFGILWLCTLFASWVCAQEPMEAQDTAYSSPPSHTSVEGFSSKLRGRSDFSNTGREWVAQLEQAGIVNRSLRGPYRVAVPLVSFGHAGPKVMITYARNLPGTNEKGVLIFLHIPLP